MSDLRGKRALVVDDDPGIRFAVSLKLKSVGCQVAEATDGVEALEYLQSATPDLVVVDVGMPRMDGYTLCQEMHAADNTRGIPVIILTAQDMEVPREVAANIGTHRFLMKPFSPRELVRTAAGLLAGGEP